MQITLRYLRLLLLSNLWGNRAEFLLRTRGRRELFADLHCAPSRLGHSFQRVSKNQAGADNVAIEPR